jgi:hypothetical protein
VQLGELLLLFQQLIVYPHSWCDMNTSKRKLTDEDLPSEDLSSSRKKNANEIGNSGNEHIAVYAPSDGSNGSHRWSEKTHLKLLKPENAAMLQVNDRSRIERVCWHRLKSKTSMADLEVKGQGTASAILSRKEPFECAFNNPQRTSEDVGSILLQVGEGHLVLSYTTGKQDRHGVYDLANSDVRISDHKKLSGKEVIDRLKVGISVEGETDNGGYVTLNPGVLSLATVGVPSWVSLDSNNKHISYGPGEMLIALRLFDFSWATMDTSNQFNTKNLSRVEFNRVVESLYLLSVPVNLDPSPFLVPSNEVTMEALANNVVTVVEQLDDANRYLYGTVAGANMSLSPPDFPEFAAAIQHSLNTPGSITRAKLGGHKQYLRITIDNNLGNSPGQPYVLEIWPANSRSPIHDHGRSCAIIKVLHGFIDVHLFPALNVDIKKPYKTVRFHAGDVTFLSPSCYQIHQLQNPLPDNEGFCATIQSYRFENNDRIHHEFFDFIDDTEPEIQHYTPVSDWDSLSFKEAIRAEWNSYWERKKQQA